jgi:hypothetical protein
MRWIFPALVWICVLASPVAGQEERSSGSFDWRAALDEAIEALSDPARITQENCAPVIRGFLDPLYTLPAAALVPHTRAEVQELRRDGVRLLGRFFQARVLLKERFNSFPNPSRACVDAVRRGLRYSRFAQDYLADWLSQHGAISQAPKRVLGGSYPHTMLNPKFDRIEFQTGDILIARGTAVVSSIIARLGDEEGDFSHLAIVSEDVHGKKYVVQSLIQTGTIITPIEKFLADTEGRVVLLRYKDRALAARAARTIIHRAAQALARGAAIPYDYAVDSSERFYIYCAELMEYAFELSSDGRVRVPRYRTSLRHLQGTPFLHEVGIYVSDVTTPQDAELDPRFDIVAEYVNIPKLRSVRLQNAAVTAMLGWFVHNYDFQPDASSEAIVHVLVAAIRLGLLGNLFTQRHVPENAVLAWYKARTVVNLLNQVSTQIDAQFNRQHGYPPTFRELLVGLERFRHDDCVALRTPVALRRHPVTLHQHLNVPSRLCPLHLPIGRNGEGETAERGGQVSFVPGGVEQERQGSADAKLVARVNQAAQ